MSQDKQVLYDEVSHDFDEQVSYKLLPELFPDTYVFSRSDLRASSYQTEHPEILEKLCNLIKGKSIWSTQDNVYIINQDVFTDILENFYLHGKEEE